MSGPLPPSVKLSEKQREILEQIVRRPSSPQGMARRAKVILKTASGLNNAQIARELDVEVKTVRKWRGRWIGAEAELSTVEAEDGGEKRLRLLIKTVLSDAPRPGAPVTFSAEEVVQIVAMACEPPEASGRPISHWTPREVAEEAIERGIVASISPRQVGRFLKGSGPATSSEPLLAEHETRKTGNLPPAGRNDL
jgi:putative transposase